MLDNKNNNVKYEDYLKSLNKDKIVRILDTFAIEHKKAKTKEELSKIVLDNVTKIVNKMLSYFQLDEYQSMKYFIKKSGIVKIKINYLLQKFLDNLVRHNIVIYEEDNTYILPNEFYRAFKLKLSNKATLKKAKENTDEYNLILGLIDIYGAYPLDEFYKIYNEKYQISKPNFEKRIMALSSFYDEFAIYEASKNKTIYIASKLLNSYAECQKLASINGDYKEFTCEEIIDVHTLKYISKYKSYKKLNKFIDRNYYVAKGNFKIINKFILMPFLECYQIDKARAKIILSTNIDKFFEFNTEKLKKKFISLAENVALDYPNWNKKGFNERKNI